MGREAERRGLEGRRAKTEVSRAGGLEDARVRGSEGAIRVRVRVRGRRGEDSRTRGLEGAIKTQVDQLTSWPVGKGEAELAGRLAS